MEALADEENSEPFGAFAFPTGLTLEHNIVSGYFGLQRSQMNVRECGQPLAGMHCKARMKLDRHNITVIARSGATKQSSENKSLGCLPRIRSGVAMTKQLSNTLRAFLSPSCLRVKHPSLPHPNFPRAMLDFKCLACRGSLEFVENPRPHLANNILRAPIAPEVDEVYNPPFRPPSCQLRRNPPTPAPSPGSANSLPHWPRPAETARRGC